METPSAYVPMDRRQALARGDSLPERCQGAALFADISGFTPLTEALVRALGPRRGAEELTRQLNSVYDALIAEVDRYGGSVIGFAGDGITCWFDGDAGLRATACGLAMQEAMRAFAVVPIPLDGTVSLAVKVAIAVGPARRFVVGDPSIQCIDVVAGATLERMAAGERLARQGEVVVDEAAATGMGELASIAAWRVENQTARRFAVVGELAQAVAEAPWPYDLSDALPNDVIGPWLLPPVHERLVAGQGEFLAELRPAVALFLRFGGIDYDADEDAGDRLDAYIRRVQRTLSRYGGYLVQVTIGEKGSYLYAAFGAPVAYDDDAERAVATALELCPPPSMGAAERALGISEVGVGIRRGRMRVGAYGGRTRRTYGILGDEVNMAARLMGKAAAGEILIGEGLADGVTRRFELELVGPISVKGKAEPLVVWRVRGRRAPSPQRPATQFPQRLVGREGELAQIGRVLDDVLAGEGRILRIEGAAGVGKSHLSAELVEMAAARGLRVVLGACQSTTQDEVYAPWRQVFHALLGVDSLDDAAGAEALAERRVAAVAAFARAMNPDWLLRLPLLADLLGLPIPDNAATAALDPRLRQHALFELATDIVQSMAARQPLLLLIDDIHWMDEASRELTVAVGRVAGAHRVLLALTHRPPLQDKPILAELRDLPSHQHLDLHELAPQGVAALVANRLGGEPHSLALALIQAEAQGNPFFAEELLDALRESGRLISTAAGGWRLSEQMLAALRQAHCLIRVQGEWALAPQTSLSSVDLGVPDSIQGIVLSRIDRLPEAAKLTMKVASVVGRVFAFAVLAPAHPAHPDDAALTAQTDTLLARDFTRREAPPPNVAYIFKHNITHEVAYDTLLYEQRRQLHRAVGAALEEIAPDAVAQLAHHSFAGQDWERALRYHMLAGEQARKLFANHLAIAHFEKALHSAEQLPEATTLDQRQSIHLALGELHTTSGHNEVAHDQLDRALALARTLGDRDAEARACRWIARWHELHGDYAPALEWIGAGLAALEGRETADAAEALVTAGLIHTRQAVYEEARRDAQQSLRIGEQIGSLAVVARAHGLLGIISRLSGKNSEAIGQYQQALDCYRQAGDTHGQGLVHNEMANAYFGVSQWSDAARHYARAHAIFGQIGDIYNQACADNNLGCIALYQGRLDDAQTYFQQGLRALDQIGGSLYLVGLFHMNLGATLIRRGAVQAAREQLRTGQGYFAQAQVRDFLPELHRHFAAAALLAGEVANAEAEAVQSLSLAREIAMRGEEGMTLRVHGEIAGARGDHAQARQHLQESIAILRELGDEYEEGRSQLSLARTLCAERRCDQALDCLDRCMAVFARLEAALDLEAARALREEIAAAGANVG